MLCASFLYSIAPASALLLDPRCHTKAECKDARSNTNIPFQQDKKADFFYTGSDARETCGKNMGFCAAASAATTKISFSGKQKFLHIGDFIQFAYKYGMVVASILAVLMIIVSGIQWTVSGGNTSTIGAAKKRIAGAITGLMLLALAYTILNIINPAMVNLRLPQVWIVKKAEIPSTYCQDIAQPDNGFTQYKSIAKKPPDQIKKIVEDEKAMEKFMSKSGTKKTTEKGTGTECGQTYIVGGQDNACIGLKCQKNKACNPATLECEKAYITGVVTPGKGDLVVTDNTDIIENIELVELCNNGDSHIRVDGKAPVENGTEIIKFGPDVDTPDKVQCTSDGGTFGFYFLVDISERNGSSDWYAAGVSNTGGATTNISINISQKIYKKYEENFHAFVDGPWYDYSNWTYDDDDKQPCNNNTDNLFCGCTAVPHAGDQIKHIWGSAKNTITGNLIKPDIMEPALAGKKPIQVVFNFNREEFPWIDESRAASSCVN